MLMTQLMVTVKTIKNKSTLSKCSFRSLIAESKGNGCSFKRSWVLIVIR